MTIDDINKRIEDIESIGYGDPEQSHVLEDRLFLEVLVEIANGAKNSQELAMAVIKTTAIDFPRWYA
jgi:hypothetical protein